MATALELLKTLQQEIVSLEDKLRYSSCLALENARTADSESRRADSEMRRADRADLRAVAPLNALRDEALRIATEHGFKDATFPEDIALIHSELSEALEDHRAGHGPNEFWYEEKKPCGIRSELADVVIRIAHLAGKHGVDLQTAVDEKMAYNETRPFKHGKVL